jgi:hypothetical protein
MIDVCEIELEKSRCLVGLAGDFSVPEWARVAGRRDWKPGETLVSPVAWTICRLCRGKEGTQLQCPRSRRIRPLEELRTPTGRSAAGGWLTRHSHNYHNPKGLGGWDLWHQGQAPNLPGGGTIHQQWRPSVNTLTT